MIDKPHDRQVAEEPAKRKTECWAHQRDAYAFAYEKRTAMLAMDMGTGKSKVVVDLAVNWGCTSQIIHARGLCRAHHQKYRRVVEGTRGTASQITWDDLVALGRCLKSRQGARDPAFVDSLLEEVEELRRSRKPLPRRRKATAAAGLDWKEFFYGKTLAEVTAEAAAKINERQAAAMLSEGGDTIADLAAEADQALPYQQPESAEVSS